MDQLNRFWFDDYPVRGELVQIGAPWKKVLERYDYPPAVKKLLGEALAAAALLVATVKLNGHISLQLQSEGAVSLLLAQADSDGRVRALARWDKSKNLKRGSLRELCPNGRLVITIEPAKGQRYQGIVGLDEPDFAAALSAYFEQSEQLSTRFWLAADGDVAAGLMLQKLPQNGGHASKMDPSIGWEHVEILAQTVTPEELCGVPSISLLKRLFAEDDLRLAENPKNITFRCFGCDLRVEQALRSLGREELVAAAEESGGTLQVECDFCTRTFDYDDAGIEQLLTTVDIPLQ